MTTEQLETLRQNSTDVESAIRNTLAFVYAYCTNEVNHLRDYQKASNLMGYSKERLESEIDAFEDVLEAIHN